MQILVRYDAGENIDNPLSDRADRQSPIVINFKCIYPNQPASVVCTMHMLLFPSLDVIHFTDLCGKGRCWQNAGKC